MPGLGSEFVRRSNNVLTLAEAAEIAASATAKPGISSVLNAQRLQALYEMAFLRAFLLWEVFLEESFVRMMCGQYSALYTPAPPVGSSLYASFSAARVKLYGKNTYILWHNPQKIIARSRRFLQLAPHETAISSAFSRCEELANIRHRIAHDSLDAKTKFNAASMSIAGRRYNGAVAGRFLRDATVGAGLKSRYLEVLIGDLQGLARQIAP